MKYFAYGSNMSENNMIHRGVVFSKKQKGTLKGYKFIINKISYKDSSLGFANIIQDYNSNVEGVLYDLELSEIKKIDVFEGFPKHYYKEIVFINIGDHFEESIVYIAQKNWTSLQELETTNEYKNKILEGKDNLSEKYYNFLNESIKVKK